MSDGHRPRVLLVDDALVIRGILNDILKADFEVVGDAGNGRDAVELAGELQPDLVVMDVTMPIMDGIEATRQITARFPGIDVVILSAVTSESSIKAGLAAGARDYLAKPPKPPEILEVLRRLMRQRQERRNQIADDGGMPGRGIWSFVGACGSDGRTTLLLSLANELLSLGRSVVVVDADLVFGDVGFYLDIDGASPTLAELLDPTETIDEANVRKAMKKHASGLEVLAKPPLGPPALEVPAQRTVDLVHQLLRLVDYVLVDLPIGVPDALLPLLDDSRYVFPVCRGLPEKLKNFKILLDLLGLCGFFAPRLCPVLTRTDREASEKIATSMKLGVQEYFPSDRKAVEEANRAAQPVTRLAPRSPYTQAVRDFVGRILEIQPTEKKEAAAKGLLQRLRGRR